MVLILSGDGLRAALPMREAIDAVREGFRLFSAGETVMPRRMGIEIAEHGGRMLCMPAYIRGLGALALKEVSVYPGNLMRGRPTIQGAVLLNDPEDGRLLAVIDGAALTAVRTGAATGVATGYLARRDASAAGIFGAGAQARTQLEALAEVRGIREAAVYDVSPGRASKFAAEMSRGLGIDVRQVDTPAKAARADVVVTATTSEEPVLRGEWLREGVHINGIGSHTPSAREVDTATMLSAGKIVVDSREAALEEAGDIIIPIREGAITAGDIHAEIGEVVAGIRAGRTSEEEVTLFKSVGIAVQDAAAAAAAYAGALRRGLGREVAI